MPRGRPGGYEFGRGMSNFTVSILLSQLVGKERKHVWFTRARQTSLHDIYAGITEETKHNREPTRRFLMQKVKSASRHVEGMNLDVECPTLRFRFFCRSSLERKESTLKRTGQSSTQYQKDRPCEKGKKTKAHAESSPVE
jgi:hypothetical protein